MNDMFNKLNTHLQSLKAKKATGESGFSLIELLVVVLIIGILSAIAIPIFLGQQDQAKDAAAKSDLANAKVAMMSYSVANSGAWATTTSQLTSYGFVQSSGVTVTIKATPVGSAFCINAVAANTHTFYVTDSSAVTSGVCP